MKKATRILAVLLIACMLVGMVGCGGGETPETTVSDGETAGVPGTEGTGEGNVWDNTTFNDYMTGSPTNWNPLEWSFDFDAYVKDRISSFFWSYRVNEAGDNFEIYCDAATAMPEDITSEFAGMEEWGIPADAVDGDGWAYRVTIRDDLCWEDGQPITAHDFIETMKRELDPKTKTARGFEWFDGNVALANARNYYWQGKDDGGETVACEWDQVGLKAEDDYTLVYILAKPCNEFFITYNGSLPLVRLDMYDEGMKSTGELQKTTYCTNQETSISWGPYILEQYQENKVIKLTKNEKWYGWNDPEYAGKDTLTYDAVSCQIIEEHATAVQLFLQGKLDNLRLKADDMAQYGASDYLHLEPGSQTTRISFNSDHDTLKSFETPGICKVMPSYESFRKGFSRAVNRKEYCATCTATNMPALGLFNELYISDPANGTIYRDTPWAQQALLSAYGDGSGTEDPNKLTGFNLEEAHALFQQAYEEAKANGDYKDGDIVELTLMMYQDNDRNQKVVNHLNDKLAEAVKGTGFEGCTRVDLIADEDFWGKAAVGEYEAIFAGYYGAEMDAPTIMLWYTDEAWHVEYGFTASEEPITAVIDGEEYTMTYKEMNLELTAGKWANADPDVRAQVLAALEEGILLQYRTVPIFYDMTGTLLSHRLTYQSDEHLPLCAFGKAIMSMNDAEWEAYIAENGGKLDY